MPRAGDRFVNKDYAETLRTIAKEGARDRSIAGRSRSKIAADMAANGGIIALEDLAQYRAMERKPLVGRIAVTSSTRCRRRCRPGASLVETLQILDHYAPRPGAASRATPTYFHHVIEAWRVRDGGARIADPARWPVDSPHLERAHARERFKLIDPAKASAYRGERGGERRRTRRSALDLADRRRSDRLPRRARSHRPGTTAFVVADAEGNMIAVTQTLSTWGGNFYVSKGLGFLYNDHLRGGRGRAAPTASSCR